MQCKIILVRPRDPNNIGAVARAMKNFGFLQLFVLAPYPPVWSEVVSAVNAEDVLTNARVVDSLVEAISDCNLVIGTTDRTRVEEKQAFYTPADLSHELRGQLYQLALVFGPEKHGLTNDDLSHCHRVMSIPTRPDCPSMNLGQSVAVCLYELVREIQQTDRETRLSDAATAGATETALHLMIDVLRVIDFVLPGNEHDLTLKLRYTLQRLNLTEYETGMLCGILKRIKRERETRESF